MPKASELKKGQVIRIGGNPYQAQHIEVQTPSARGANTLYKVRFQGVTTGQKLEQTYKGNDFLEDMEVMRRPVSYLYSDRESYVFMDSENFEQYNLNEKQLGDQVKWLVDGISGIYVLLSDGAVLSIELPGFIDLEIVDTAPAIKGATVTNRNKSATLANGVVIQVPEYLQAGEIVRVNTETGKYLSRSKG